MASGVPGLIGEEHTGEERGEVRFLKEGQNEVKASAGGVQLSWGELIEPVVVVWEEGYVAQIYRRTLEEEVEGVG